MKDTKQKISIILRDYYASKKFSKTYEDALYKIMALIKLEKEQSKNSFPDLDQVADFLQCTEKEKFGIVACVYESIKKMTKTNTRKSPKKETE